MAQAHSSIPKDPHTTAIGLMTSSTDTAVKLGMKARSNSKANTIKERKMGAEDTNGPMEATTMETSSTVYSRVRASITSRSLRGHTRVSLLRIFSKVRESSLSKMDACTKGTSRLAKKKVKEQWSSQMAISTLASGKTTCNTG